MRMRPASLLRKVPQIQARGIEAEDQRKGPVPISAEVFRPTLAETPSGREKKESPGDGPGEIIIFGQSIGEGHLQLGLHARHSALLAPTPYRSLVISFFPATSYEHPFLHHPKPPYLPSQHPVQWPRFALQMRA